MRHRTAFGLAAFLAVAAGGLAEDYGDLLDRDGLESEGGEVGDMEMMEGDPDGGEDEGDDGDYPGSELSNDGPADGYAIREYPLALLNDFAVEGTVRPLFIVSANTIAGLELDMRRRPEDLDQLIFFFLGANRTGSGFNVFLARNGNPNLGARFVASAAVDLRLASTGGVLYAWARATGTEEWEYVAETNLDHPEECHMLATGAAHLGDGEGCRVMLRRVENGPFAPPSGPAEAVLQGLSNVFENAVNGVVAAGAETPDAGEAADRFGEALEACGDVRDVLAELPRTPGVRKADKGMRKIEKVLGKAADRALAGKDEAALKAGMQGLDVASNAGPGLSVAVGFE